MEYMDRLLEELVFMNKNVYLKDGWKENMTKDLLIFGTKPIITLLQNLHQMKEMMMSEMLKIRIR